MRDLPQKSEIQGKKWGNQWFSVSDSPLFFTGFPFLEDMYEQNHFLDRNLIVKLKEKNRKNDKV
jgi:hypothetical protein